MLSNPFQSSQFNPTTTTTLDGNNQPKNPNFLGGLDHKKILLVGSERAGKSFLIQRYLTNEFGEDINDTAVYKQSFGADLCTKFIAEGDIRLALNIWTLSGAKRYRSCLTPLFTSDVAMVIVCVDLLNSKSLDVAKEYFELAKELTPTAFTILVGTKADEVDKFAYKLPDLAKIANDMEAVSFKTTSAKTGLGINELFEEICSKIKAL